MKFTKIAALAAVAVMACGVFYGCDDGSNTSAPAGTSSSQAQNQEASVVGTWKLDMEGLVKDQFKAQTGSEVDVNSAEFKQAMELIKSQMGDIIFDLKADGTLTSSVEMGGQKVESTGTYTVEGGKVNATIEGQTQTFDFDSAKNTLSVSVQGQTVTLKKA